MLRIALAMLLPQDTLPPATPARCRALGELFDDAATVVLESPGVDLSKLPEKERPGMEKRQAALKAYATRMVSLSIALDARYPMRPPAARGRPDDSLPNDDAALFALADKCIAAPR